jgi:ribosome-binding factor A
MDSTRQNKFSKLILKELAAIFSREGKNYYGNAFVTITEVKVTPDLSMVKVYLSLFKEKNPNVLLELIRQHSKEIRKNLGNRIRNQVRIVPELQFYIDDTLDYAEKIDILMKNIVIPPDINDEEK